MRTLSVQGPKPLKELAGTHAPGVHKDHGLCSPTEAPSSVPTPPRTVATLRGAQLSPPASPGLPVDHGTVGPCWAVHPASATRGG